MPPATDPINNDKSGHATGDNGERRDDELPRLGEVGSVLAIAKVSGYVAILASAHPSASGVQCFTQEDLDAFADINGEIGKCVLRIPPASHIQFFKRPAFAVPPHGQANAPHARLARAARSPVDLRPPDPHSAEISPDLAEVLRAPLLAGLVHEE